MRRDEDVGVVAFAVFGAGLPREAFGVERELGIDPGLVPARIEPMPRPVEVDRDETVEREPFAVVGQALVAEPGGNALSPQDRGEQMRLAVAEPDALSQRLRCRQRDSTILGIPGVLDAVAHKFKRRGREQDVVGVLSSQPLREGRDFGVTAIDDLICA